MLAALSDELTRQGGGEDDWTPYDVVGHLIHAEKTDWIPRAEVILAAGEGRRFPPFDRMGHFADAGSTLDERLNEFERIRESNLARLVDWRLTDTQLELTGIHPEFGSVTLGHLIATWAVHDLTHVRQISTFLARKFALAVGPWSQYLSILK